MLAGLLCGQAAAQQWNPVRGQAADLAVSPDGPVYAAGVDGALWRWIEGTPEWTPIPGKATRLAAGPAGTLWAVSEGLVVRYEGARWVRMQQRARDVAADAAGNGYAVLEDFSLARWDARTRAWQALPGRGARVAAGGQGVVWLVKEDRSLERLDGQAWVSAPGRARDIAVSPEGTVFIAALDGTLQRWNGTSWSAEPGVTGVALVAAGQRSTPWVANEAGAILTRAFVKPGALELAASETQAPQGISFRRSSRRSALMASNPRQARAEARGAAVVTLKPPAQITDPAPFEFVDTLGTASRLAIGQDGSVFAVALDGTLTRWSNQQRRFLTFPGSLQRIAVDPGGSPWGINQAGRIFRHTGTDWLQVRGTASDISVAADRTVMTASSSGQLSRYVPATDSFTLVPGEAFFIALAPDGTPWGLLQDGTVVRCRAVPCERVGFNATNIAIGPDGSVFIVTFSRELRRFNAETGLFDIIPVPGHTPVLVAVGPFGRPWVITTTGKVLSSRYFERDESADLTTASSTVTPTTGTGDVSTVLGTTSEGGGFTFNRNMQFTSAFAGCAAGDDIVLGVDGTAIMRCGFSELFRYNTTTRTFQPLTNVPTSAVVALDIDAEGRIWFVDGAVNGRIYRQRQRNGSAYDTLTYPAGTGAFARDFVLGPNGTAYVINSGGELYRRTLEATSFTKMISGAWTRVAVGVSNDIWLIDPEERLFQLVGNTVERRPPSGTQPNTTDIGGARDGTIYAIQFYSGVDSGATLYRWNATNRAFDRVNRLADRVDVAPNGRPWIMNLGESGAYFAR